MIKKILFCLVFLCGVAFAQEFTILHTSDIHGRLAPIEYNGVNELGGFARRVEYFNQTRAYEENVLIFDAGDYYQGSIYYRLFKGVTDARLLKYAKYNAMTFGNHEFDDGIKKLKKLVKISKTPYISTNLEFEDGYLAKNVKKYQIYNIGSDKVLIMAITTPELPNLSNANGVKILDTVDELKNTIKKVAPDFVVLISHCGIKYDEFVAKKVPEIDIILGGHDHIFLKYPKKVGNTYIFHQGEFGVNVGKITLDTKEGFKNYEQIFMTPDKPMNSKVQKYINKYSQIVEETKNTTVATLKEPLFALQNYVESHQTYIGQIILESFVKNVPYYDIAFINSGSIRLNKILNHKISYADVLEILPFENNVAYADVKGEDLLEALEHGTEPGRSYLQILSNIDDIEEDKYYRVVTTDYLLSGKDGFDILKNAKNLTVLNLTQFNAFLNHLKALKVLGNSASCESRKSSEKSPNEEALEQARGL